MDDGPLHRFLRGNLSKDRPERYCLVRGDRQATLLPPCLKKTSVYCPAGGKDAKTWRDSREERQ